MNLWTDLTAAALLGSGRGFIPVPLPGQLNELLTDAPVEERLLRTAGILATAQIAALTVKPSPEPAPASAPPAPDRKQVLAELDAGRISFEDAMKQLKGGD